MALHFSSQPSSWMNWGLWTPGTTTFKQACKNLAHKLAQTANLSPGDKVLDVGFGCGDQDIFWSETFGPLDIFGINISRPQVKAARRKVEAKGLSSEIRLVSGAAPRLPKPQIPFDKILCLDCAYHFDRAVFFKEAYGVIKPGGTLALADIVFNVEIPSGIMSGIKGKAIIAFTSLLLGVPRENFYPVSTYQNLLRHAGFKKVEIETIPNELVWPSFVAWIGKYRKEIGELTAAGVLYNFEQAARFMSMLARAKYISLVVVRASK